MPLNISALFVLASFSTLCICLFQHYIFMCLTVSLLFVFACCSTVLGNQAVCVWVSIWPVPKVQAAPWQLLQDVEGAPNGQNGWNHLTQKCHLQGEHSDICMILKMILLKNYYRHITLLIFNKKFEFVMVLKELVETA